MVEVITNNCQPNCWNAMQVLPGIIFLHHWGCVLQYSKPAQAVFLGFQFSCLLLQLASMILALFWHGLRGVLPSAILGMQWELTVIGAVGNKRLIFLVRRANKMKQPGPDLFCAIWPW